MQLLYQELRKMRGMGEELDMLQQAQRDVVTARYCTLIRNMFYNYYMLCAVIFLAPVISQSD